MRANAVNAMKLSKYALLLIVFFAPHVRSGVVSPCEDPTMLRSANVQVYILPYTATQNLTPNARALATLMQRHILFAALKYRSIAVAELTEHGDRCNLEKIEKKLRAQLRPDQTAILLSGTMFEQDDKIYLKSSVTVLKNPRHESLSWPIGDSHRTALVTRTPTVISSFAPRTIPLSYLDRMQEAQQEARRVYASPNAASAAREFPDYRGAQLIFYVLDANDDWMKIRVMPYDIEGWVPAHALATADHLKSEFPELHFVDGLIGLYGISQDRERAERTAQQSRDSLQRYLHTTTDTVESEPRSVAAVLQGNSYLLGTSNWSDKNLRSAQRDYRFAREMMPTSLVAANHDLACTTMLCARGACGDERATLHQQYLSVLGIDPANRELLNNLHKFYSLASNGVIHTDLSADDLKQRQHLLTELARTAL